MLEISLKYFIVVERISVKYIAYYAFDIINKWVKIVKSLICFNSDINNYHCTK